VKEHLQVQVLWAACGRALHTRLEPISRTVLDRQVDKLSFETGVIAVLVALVSQHCRIDNYSWAC